MSAVLRAARAEDAPVLAQILGDWVRETGWMPVLHTREEDVGFLRRLIATSQVTVAELDAPVGFIARRGETVPALYLAPGARGRGVGSQLLTAVQSGQTRLELWTFAANAGARRFYARLGFVESGGTAGDNDEGLPDIRLEWSAGNTHER